MRQEPRVKEISLDLLSFPLRYSALEARVAALTALRYSPLS